VEKLDIRFDREKCVACKRCVIECAVAHSKSKDLVGAMEEDPPPESRVRATVDKKGRIAIVRCVHCEKPKCVEACKPGALTKPGPGEAVEYNAELCTSCLECVEACPFGAIRPSRSGKGIIKCDLCRERLEKGELPACVEACATGALDIREPAATRK
jgi:carbon-monoxide dehydrogenase iron sulfur subunit